MRIAILGHFGIGERLLNGQTVKSKNLVCGLEGYTDAEIVKIDSHGWTKAPLRLLKNIKAAFKVSDAVIMLPAHNGVRVFAPLLLHYKKKYKKKIYYDVIGGWLPEFLKDKRRLSDKLRQFDGIWTETSTMKKALDEQGFENVSVIPNFKELAPLSRDELVFPDGAPLRLCTFSRVMREKGIETAVNAIKDVNGALGYTAFSLDIYGQADRSQTEWFECLKADFPEYVSYPGCADPQKSVEILKNYFALLFPTHFYTEGIPGTIIDAYAAGIPVISAKWESFSDVIDDGKTGVGYQFDSYDGLCSALLNAARDPDMLIEMKENALLRSHDFMSETVIRDLISKIN